jgi:hypothetical protein
MTCRESIRVALGRTREACVDTCWTDAGPISVPEWLHCGDAPYAGGDIMESGYRMVLFASPKEEWDPISKIGDRNGWYFADFR